MKEPKIKFVYHADRTMTGIRVCEHPVIRVDAHLIVGACPQVGTGEAIWPGPQIYRLDRERLEAGLAVFGNNGPAAYPTAFFRRPAPAVFCVAFGKPIGDCNMPALDAALDADGLADDVLTLGESDPDRIVRRVLDANPDLDAALALVESDRR